MGGVLAGVVVTGTSWGIGAIGGAGGAGAGAAATTLSGALRAAGTGVEVALSGLTVDGTTGGVAGCWPDLLDARAGARVVAGPDVTVLQTASPGGACRVFEDGFESGGTRAWSAAAP